jgi:hypothetical protein
MMATSRADETISKGLRKREPSRTSPSKMGNDSGVESTGAEDVISYVLIELRGPPLIEAGSFKCRMILQLQQQSRDY